MDRDWLGKVGVLSWLQKGGFDVGKGQSKYKGVKVFVCLWG